MTVSQWVILSVGWCEMHSGIGWAMRYHTNLGKEGHISQLYLSQPWPRCSVSFGLQMRPLKAVASKLRHSLLLGWDQLPSNHWKLQDACGSRRSTVVNCWSVMLSAFQTLSVSPQLGFSMLQYCLFIALKLHRKQTVYKFIGGVKSHSNIVNIRIHRRHDDYVLGMVEKFLWQFWYVVLFFSSEWDVIRIQCNCCESSGL